MLANNSLVLPSLKESLFELLESFVKLIQNNAICAQKLYTEDIFVGNRLGGKGSIIYSQEGQKLKCRISGLTSFFCVMVQMLNI